MVEGLLSSRVLIWEHLETCLFVIILVLIEDPIEVRELPRENVGRQKHSLYAHKASSLCHCSNEGRKRSDDGTDESVPWTCLLHGQVKAQVWYPHRIRDHPCEWCELSVSNEWGNWEASSNEASSLWTNCSFYNGSISCSYHQLILISFFDLTETLGWHGYSLGSEEECQGWQESDWSQWSMIKEHGVWCYWIQ